MSARSNTGVRVSKEVRPKWMAELQADLKLDQAPGDDKKILECLGAAVIMRWVSSDQNPAGALRTRDFAGRPRADSSAEGPNRALPA